MGFDFTPGGVVVWYVAFWATGLLAGAVGAVLSSLTRRG
jgi:hypothetical protein